MEVYCHGHYPGRIDHLVDHCIIVGFIAIFLVVGVLHWHIIGEPYLNGVPLVTSILAAAVLVLIWSAFAYHHASGYYARYYRRGGYAGRPRRRYRWF